MLASIIAYDLVGLGLLKESLVIEDHFALGLAEADPESRPGMLRLWLDQGLISQATFDLLSPPARSGS